MAVLTTQTISQMGLTPTLSAASADGDQWEPSTGTFLIIRNNDETAHTVTVVTTASAFDQPIADVNVTVASGGEALLGPYPPGEVANPANGLGTMTYDSPTGLTVAAISI